MFLLIFCLLNLSIFNRMLLKVSNCNSGFISFSLKFYQFLAHLLGAYMLRVVMSSLSLHIICPSLSLITIFSFEAFFDIYIAASFFSIHVITVYIVFIFIKILPPASPQDLVFTAYLLILSNLCLTFSLHSSF